ncbi:hypothetical protein TSUD_179900 [Trifolium subterraneum]|uniref:Uncharacterized protein n=1 Tax=Trifolium subterraneum TaxID=3900 RepID=A0A2Z6P1I0_TRISU|nr:hypothetical protein TSUD_179900 [Trifolium subterraneum]
MAVRDFNGTMTKHKHKHNDTEFTDKFNGEYDARMKGWLHTNYHSDRITKHHDGERLDYTTGNETEE